MLDLDLVVQPWALHAACPDELDVDFFPPRGGDVRPAKRICARCFVRDECLAFAMSFAENALPGVWGGTSERERKALRRRAA